MPDFSAAAPFRWQFEYLEEEHAAGKAHRPVAEIRINPSPEWDQKIVALVDSGCDLVLATRWVQQAIGLDPDPATERQLGVGGRPRRVRFAEVTLELLPPPNAPDAEPIQWRSEVGFIQDQWEPFWGVVLGRAGFFDKFTVTMHGHHKLLVVEHFTAFDERF